MTGATAGTAILHRPKEKTKDLHTVTLTINNICEGKCSHCYLQYDGREGSMSQEDAISVLDANFNHLAIVGKEPCLNPDLIEYLTRENMKKERTTSIITNGISLDKLTEETLVSLDYIDVSFDGGSITYMNRRGNDFNKIITNLENALTYFGKSRFNALHTIYKENLDSLDDMMNLEKFFPFDKIAFSLYQVPYNHGNVRVTRGSLIKEILPTFITNSKFRESQKSILLISKLDLTTGNPEHFFEEIRQQGIEDKINYISNPLAYGFVRVTYDGKILTPNDAIHPILYNIKGFSLKDFKTLNELFTQLQKNFL